MRDNQKPTSGPPGERWIDYLGLRCVFFDGRVYVDGKRLDGCTLSDPTKIEILKRLGATPCQQKGP